MSDAKRHRLEELPPSQISEDRDRFQSRAEYRRDGSDEDLDDVQLYDLHAAQVLSLWRDSDDERLYVIDGHRRLRLAKRLQIPVVLVQYLDEATASEAFAKGVELNLSQWAFERGDKLRWSIESRRAAVECALRTGWLDPDRASAIRLYKFYPDLGRRYSSFPADYREGETG